MDAFLVCTKEELQHTKHDRTWGDEAHYSAQRENMNDLVKRGNIYKALNDAEVPYNYAANRAIALIPAEDDAEAVHGGWEGFCVENKKSGELVRVYGVTKDAHGYPHFVIYKDGQWRTVSAKYFRPA